jgi:hypothetical protein
MATYSAPNYTYNYPMPYHGQANNLQCLLDATVTCTAAPSTSDTLNFGYLPPNACVTGGILIPSDMDTNGSPALTLNIGDAGSATRYFSGSTGGQTGTADATLAAAGRGYTTTAKTLVTGVAGVNAATGAAGTIRLLLFGFIKDLTTSG